MKDVGLKKAVLDDVSSVVGLDHRLNKEEHAKLNRKAKIESAIANGECNFIMLGQQAVGFVIFDHRFFDQGWIELIVIDEEHRGKGIGVSALELICKACKTIKVFTSTNTSNVSMQRALAKAGFTYAGKVDGLDEGDPELFYYKRIEQDRV